MENTITLFCVPHAGASASGYVTWKRVLPEHIVIRPVELSGRGRRIYETLYGSMEEAVNDIYKDISEELGAAPYAFFGHSMGTILAYELARIIRQKHHREPAHMFFSGRFPPFVYDDRERFYTLPDDLFLQKIYELGGTDAAILENKELLDLILPVLRSDYGMVERYRHQGEIFRFDCDITILHGRHDEYTNTMDLQRWHECARKGCAFHEFDGGHFFIQPFKSDIAGIIQRALSA